MFDIEGLPAETRYCAWRTERVGGRLTKIPYGGTGGDVSQPRKASSTDRSTWLTADNAVRLAKFLERQWSDSDHDFAFSGGVGIMLGRLTDGSLLAGIDLDSCVDDAGMTGWASSIVEVVAGYWELSPSGTGAKLLAIVPAAEEGAVRHALGLGTGRDGLSWKKRAAGGNKAAGIEAYLGRRFFALTGDALGAKQIRKLSISAAARIRSIGEGLKATKPILAANQGPASSTTECPVGDGTATSLPELNTLSSDPRMAAVGSARLRRLWSGDLSDLGDDRSRSAIAFRLGLEMANVGFLGEDIAAAVCAHELTADWAVEKGMVLGGREMTRLLAHARPAVSFGALPVVEGLSSADPAPRSRTRSRARSENPGNGEENAETAPVDEAALTTDDGSRGLLWPADGGLPVLRVRVPLHEVVDMAEEAVLLSGIPVMHRGQRLVYPIMKEAKGPGGRTTTTAAFQEMILDDARDTLSKSARWVRWDPRLKGGGDWVKCNPPVEIVSTWLSRVGSWRAPHTTGIVTAPTLRWDGSVLSEPGLDVATGLYLMPDPELVMPAGWNTGAPVRADAMEALGLLDGLLDEFPFVGVMDRSVALSAIVTLVIRGALGARPMHAFNAHEAGTGKTYLVDVVTAIALGRSAPLATPGKTEEETEKRLGSMLMAGIPVGVLDNVNGPLGGSLLAQTITQELLTIRVLGVSKMPIVENLMCLLATGNNMTIVGEMVRRTLECRLDALVEQPESRKFSRDPLGAIRADRGRYVAAALTVARAHALAGYPGMGVGKPLVSFEDWSRMVRGALVWLGRADPVETVDRARSADPERNDLGTLTRLWEARFGRGPDGARGIREALDTFGAGGGPGPITSSATITPSVDMAMEKLGYKSTAEASAAFREIVQRLAGRNGTVDPVRLGRWMDQHAGRVIGILRFAKAESNKHTKTQTWMVEYAAGHLRIVDKERET